MTHRNAFLAVLGVCLLGACGVPCDMLEDKICDELGEADCKVWKETDAPAALRSGRRAAKGCFNALTGPTFDAHIQGAKAMVEAQKAVNAS